MLNINKQKTLKRTRSGHRSACTPLRLLKDASSPVGVGADGSAAALHRCAALKPASMVTASCSRLQGCTFAALAELNGRPSNWATHGYQIINESLRHTGGVSKHGLWVLTTANLLLLQEITSARCRMWGVPHYLWNRGEIDCIGLLVWIVKQLLSQ